MNAFRFEIERLDRETANIKNLYFNRRRQEMQGGLMPHEIIPEEMEELEGGVPQQMQPQMEMEPVGQPGQQPMMMGAEGDEKVAAEGGQEEVA